MDEARPVIRYKDISRTLRRFIGVHEAYRRMGFSADDIFAETCTDGLSMLLSCFALLRAQGKEFRVCCGPIDSEPTFAEEHRRVLHAILAKEVPQADLDRIWKDAQEQLQMGQFMMAIVRKGIVPPTAAPN
jgi:hypothetical protein